MAYRSFSPSEFEARGARKVTTGITGLWQRSVHSEFAFLSFYVGSSYHTEAEFGKRWIVHPLRKKKFRMSATLSTDAPAGRAKHLGELAQIFRHRHGTWREFGQFLKREFKDPSGHGSMVGAASGKASMPCRHTSGGRHHAIISATIATHPGEEPFNHERYSRPCISHGVYDHGKNGGLVVHDLCVRAAAFLKSIGKGDPYEFTRRDFDYDPSFNLPSSSPLAGSSQVSNASGDIDMSEDVTITQALVTSGASDDEFDDDGFFEDEDVLAILGGNEGEWPERLSSSVSVSDLPESQDSAEQFHARGSSTKMRAATLAYLWNFADHPGQLRTQFRRLRKDPTAYVLHLCGCGLCYCTSNDVRVVGCAERSHLKLGPAEENGRHRTFHHILELGQSADYVPQVAIIHRSTDGDGIF